MKMCRKDWSENMTVKELILELLDVRMDSKIYVYDEENQVHIPLVKSLELDKDGDLIIKI